MTSPSLWERGPCRYGRDVAAVRASACSDQAVLFLDACRLCEHQVGELGEAERVGCAVCAGPGDCALIDWTYLPSLWSKLTRVASSPSWSRARATAPIAAVYASHAFLKSRNAWRTIRLCVRRVAGRPFRPPAVPRRRALQRPASRLRASAGCTFTSWSRRRRRPPPCWRWVARLARSRHVQPGTGRTDWEWPRTRSRTTEPFPVPADPQGDRCC
jgi:hypothetical protein